MTRGYEIQDDGDAIQVALLEDGQQVGGAYFPDDGSGEAFQDALELAQAWEQTGGVRPGGSQSAQGGYPRAPITSAARVPIVSRLPQPCSPSTDQPAHQPSTLPVGTRSPPALRMLPVQGNPEGTSSERSVERSRATARAKRGGSGFA